MDEKRLLFIDIKTTSNSSTTAEGTQTNQTSLGKRLWNRSDNSFTFDFFSESSPAPEEEPPDKQQTTGLTHLTEQDSGFSFNFQIPTVTSEDMKTDTTPTPAPSEPCPPGEETCAKEENPSKSLVTNPTSEPPVSSKGKKKKKSGKKKSSESTEAQQKPISTEASKADEGTLLTAEQQLQRELDWCIEQLEFGMKTQKSTSKQKEDTSSALKTLRSSKAPLAKKRQVMRAMAGDYRKTMEAEKDKQYKLIQNAVTSARVKAVNDSSKKSVFHRRADIKTETHYTDIKSEQETLQTGAQAPNTSTHPQGEASHFVFTPSKEEFCFNFL